VSDRAALLEAIRANPHDEALRLVYADWLEEYGDEADRTLARFIRVQCRFEPFRDVYHDHQADALRAEEAALLAANSARWLGPPLNDSAWEHHETCDAQFRRGMVERLSMPAEAFPETAETLVERFAGFHHLFLFDLRGRCAWLARSPHLSAVRELTLADECEKEDARALAASPHLRHVTKLRIWVWRAYGVRHCVALSKLPALQEIELYQLVTASHEGDEINEEMASLIQQFQKQSKVPVHIVNPYARKFPLYRDVAPGLYAGRVRDGRQTLVLAGRVSQLLFFDDDGQLNGEEECDMDQFLSKPPTPGLGFVERELLDHLRPLYGFEPGLIHVRAIQRDDLTVCLPFWGDWESHFVLKWHEEGIFRLDYGDAEWGGPDGRARRD
jgi:uncharacterized protein (TIGR02996 family)